MSKILIISDIHNKVRIADQIIESAKGNYDSSLFLGDYQDNFNDNEIDARKTAIWLKEKLSNKNDIFLIANHDHSYRYKYNTNAYCSGFTHEKAAAIWKVLNIDDFNKLRAFYIEPDTNILFSHAGVAKKFLNFMIAKGYIDKFDYTIENIRTKLIEWEITANQNFSMGNDHPLYNAGWSRGGNQQVGGIIWCDYSEFNIINGIYQIFSHTPQPIPSFKFTKDTGQQFYAYTDNKFKCTQYLKNSYGLNLDTHLNHYAILDTFTGFIKIYKVIYDKDYKHRDRNVIDKELIFDKRIVYKTTDIIPDNFDNSIVSTNDKNNYNNGPFSHSI